VLQLFQAGQAVHAWQHHVQQQQIETIRTGFVEKVFCGPEAEAGVPLIGDFRTDQLLKRGLSSTTATRRALGVSSISAGALHSLWASSERPTILESSNALCSGRYIVLMGHHHQGDALLVEFIKQFQHLGGGAGVQSPCGFVR